MNEMYLENTNELLNNKPSLEELEKHIIKVYDGMNENISTKETNSYKDIVLNKLLEEIFNKDQKL
jgi:hypothetical protein